MIMNMKLKLSNKAHDKWKFWMLVNNKIIRPCMFCDISSVINNSFNCKVNDCESYQKWRVIRLKPYINL